MRIKDAQKVSFKSEDLQAKALICTFVVKRRINPRKVTLKNGLSYRTYVLL